MILSDNARTAGRPLTDADLRELAPIDIQGEMLRRMIHRCGQARLAWRFDHQHQSWSLVEDPGRA